MFFNYFQNMDWLCLFLILPGMGDQHYFSGQMNFLSDLKCGCLVKLFTIHAFADLKTDHCKYVLNSQMFYFTNTV